jgi:pyrroline-5-carboxylate reductase
MTALLPVPTWFVGCGNMAGAMVEGWRSAGVDLSSATVIRPSGRPVEGIRTVTEFLQAGNFPAMVVLGCKPQQLDDVAPELARYVTPNTMIVSILAGVEAESLRDRFRSAGSIVRAIPNLPVAVRRGIVGLFSEDALDNMKHQLGELFSTLGYAMWMADEAKLAALGSVAGAGPAYVARFIAALAKAGEARGLSTEIAQTIAQETVLGTAWLAATTRESMGDIARRVASRNGTTEAGLAVLDHDNVLDQLIGVTIEAAARRGAELAAEARSLAEQPRLS